MSQSVQKQYYGYDQQNTIYTPSLDEVNTDYKDGYREDQYETKSRKIALLIWGLTPMLCINNLYMGRVNKAVYILIANIFATFVLQLHRLVVTKHPFLASTGTVVGYICLAILFVNWIREFFQIVFGDPKDDQGSPIF